MRGRLAERVRHAGWPRGPRVRHDRRCGSHPEYTRQQQGRPARPGGVGRPARQAAARARVVSADAQQHRRARVPARQLGQLGRRVRGGQADAVLGRPAHLGAAQPQHTGSFVACCGLPRARGPRKRARTRTPGGNSEAAMTPVRTVGLPACCGRPRMRSPAGARARGGRACAGGLTGCA